MHLRFFIGWLILPWLVQCGKRREMSVYEKTGTFFDRSSYLSEFKLLVPSELPPDARNEILVRFLSTSPKVTGKDLYFYMSEDSGLAHVVLSSKSGKLYAWIPDVARLAVRVKNYELLETIFQHPLFLRKKALQLDEPISYILNPQDLQRLLNDIFVKDGFHTGTDWKSAQIIIQSCLALRHHFLNEEDDYTSGQILNPLMTWAAARGDGASLQKLLQLFPGNPFLRELIHRSVLNGHTELFLDLLKIANGRQTLTPVGMEHILILGAISGRQEMFQAIVDSFASVTEKAFVIAYTATTLSGKESLAFYIKDRWLRSVSPDDFPVALNSIMKDQTILQFLTLESFDVIKSKRAFSSFFTPYVIRTILQKAVDKGYKEVASHLIDHRITNGHYVEFKTLDEDLHQIALKSDCLFIFKKLYQFGMTTQFSSEILPLYFLKRAMDRDAHDIAEWILSQYPIKPSELVDSFLYAKGKDLARILEPIWGAKGKKLVSLYERKLAKEVAYGSVTNTRILLFGALGPHLGPLMKPAVLRNIITRTQNQELHVMLLHFSSSHLPPLVFARLLSFLGIAGHIEMLGKTLYSYGFIDRLSPEQLDIVVTPIANWKTEEIVQNMFSPDLVSRLSVSSRQKLFSLLTVNLHEPTVYQLLRDAEISTDLDKPRLALQAFGPGAFGIVERLVLSYPLEFSSTDIGKVFLEAASRSQSEKLCWSILQSRILRDRLPQPVLTKAFNLALRRKSFFLLQSLLQMSEVSAKLSTHLLNKSFRNLVKDDKSGLYQVFIRHTLDRLSFPKNTISSQILSRLRRDSVVIMPLAQRYGIHL